MQQETENEIRDITLADSSGVMRQETFKTHSKKPSTNYVATKLTNFVSSLHWSTWVGIGFSVLVSLIWVIPNFKSTPPPKETSNPVKPLYQLPAFDEGQLSQSTRDELDDLNQQIAYFLNEETQRIRVQMALGFLAIASEKVGDGCKTQIECLQSFAKQRIANLENVIDNIEFEKGILPPDKTGLLQPLRSQLIVTKEVEAWRLALMLVKPNELRTPQERWEIETRYPILRSRVAVESLTPRPAVLTQLLKASEQKKLALRAGSPEEQARFERQQRLCQEQNICNLRN